MNKNYYINLLLTKNVEIHNRITSKIEELLRKDRSNEELKREVEELMQALEYVIEEMRRSIGRK